MDDLLQAVQRANSALLHAMEELSSAHDAGTHTLRQDEIASLTGALVDLQTIQANIVLHSGKSFAE